MSSEFEKQVARNRLRQDVQELNQKLKREDAVYPDVQNLNKSEQPNERSERQSS